MFSYKVSKKDKSSNARIGTFKTPHGEIKTPVFMPVGTLANVKTLTPEDLDKLNAQIILANTYHLYLRPGHKLIKKMGGLHKWMNYKKPILTDSGGFQVFSLSQKKGFSSSKHPYETKVKVDDKGVEFKSHLDGSRHFFTPEKVMQIEHDLGADIIMAFDECPPHDVSKQYAKESLERTHNWALKCKKEHEKLNKNQKIKQALFPIIQGGMFDDLRIESAKYISDLNLPGIAIGGLSVGENKDTMYHVIETLEPFLPQNKPRYLMGVGTPEDLIECVKRGIDMFDCVLPTRLARHGTYWDFEGRQNIKLSKYKTDDTPLSQKCTCYTCQNFSKSYLRHLIIENEILGMRLMTVHNLHFLLNLMEEIKGAIKEDKLERFATNFLKSINIRRNES